MPRQDWGQGHWWGSARARVGRLRAVGLRIALDCVTHGPGSWCERRAGGQVGQSQVFAGWSYNSRGQ
eukprot:2474198-Rhodomonas_salina.3